MLPWVSLPHSQQAATCPYLEPDQTIPYLPNSFLRVHCNIILLSTPSSSKWLFPSGCYNEQSYNLTLYYSNHLTVNIMCLIETGQFYLSPLCRRWDCLSSI